MRVSVNKNKLGDSSKSGFKMGRTGSPDRSRLMRPKPSPICLNQETKSGGCAIHLCTKVEKHSKTLLQANKETLQTLNYL